MAGAHKHDVGKQKVLLSNCNSNAQRHLLHVTIVHNQTSLQQALYPMPQEHALRSDHQDKPSHTTTGSANS